MSCIDVFIDFKNLKLKIDIKFYSKSMFLTHVFDNIPLSITIVCVNRLYNLVIPYPI